ncbi:MAG: SCO family protein [Betaproteobacteria bacterium]|nr:SCO family protein [Betaproteobacteria bacterium]
MLWHTFSQPEWLPLVLGLSGGAGAVGLPSAPPAERVSAPAAAIIAPAAAAENSVFDEKTALGASQRVIGEPVGDYEVTDRSGKRIRLVSYRGKPLLVSFVYTGCTHVCPTTTKFLAGALAEAQRALGADSFATLTIGFNVPFDTPQAMRDFARRQGVRLANWEFAAADAATVGALTRDLGFSYYPVAGGFDHITQVTIVDAAGRVYRQVYGESFDLPQLVEPLRELVTGTPLPALSLPQMLDKIRVLCTVYDPASGRYRLNYALFIEIFAGLTVIGGTLLFLVIGRHRARRSRG